MKYDYTTFYEDDSDDYGFKTLQKFLDRKKNPPKIGRPRKRGSNKGSRPKKSYKNVGRSIENRYAIIDPVTYLPQRFFDNIQQLQNYFNLGRLQPRIYDYEHHKVSVRSNPTIKGYIVVRWKDKEVFSFDHEQFVKFLQDRVKGWMIINQMDRIRENIQSIDKETLDKLFKYLNKIENINY
jgi:hypothetical protein